MLWLNYFVIVALLLGIVAKYISPALVWLIAFFGLAFPFVFILNALFIIYWFIQFKRTIIFGVFAAILSLPNTYLYLQFSKPNKGSKNSIKVTSYNCMLFDLYNWNKNKETRNKIFSDLSDNSPDILCLQEFYTSEEKNDFNNIDTLKHLLKTDYVHTEYTTTLRKYDHWGIATFSKYKIINQGKLVFHTKSNNLCIFTDVIFNSDTVRVYNIHLQSISFSKDDNKFLDDVVSNNEANEEIEHGKNILRRLKRAFVKRSAQVDMIAAHIKTCKYKIILCGDFNDTAASYAYHELTQNLNDAFVEKGNGFGRTYAGKWPQFRIDYILHSNTFKCTSYERMSETFTDHYPITANFELKNKL